jgi:hypothetical protein
MLGRARGEKTSESEHLNTLWVHMDHLVMLAQPKKKVAPLSNILHTTAKQPTPCHPPSTSTTTTHYTSYYHHDYKQTNTASLDDTSCIIWALGMFYYY